MLFATPADRRSMETIVLEQTTAPPPIALDEYLKRLKGTAEEASAVWPELVESLHNTNELARLARGLAI